MLGKENGWYKISYEGKTAYVYEDYVKEKKIKKMIFSKKLLKQTEPAAFLK